MKRKFMVGGLICLSVMTLRAQDANQIEKFNQQLKQIQENFEKQQREMRENFEKVVKEQQAQIDALKKQIAGGPSNAIAGAASTNTASAEDVDALKERVNELANAVRRPSVNQFNPGIGFVGDTVFGFTSKGSAATGSERPGGVDVFMRTAELNLEATVDPFARAYGVISATADPITGEANLGVEEAALVTTSLPWNLTAQAGRFFADFGRLSYIHDHDLPFVYRPLVLDQYIGGESRTEGIQVNYLFPTKQYVSLTLGGGNSFGGDTGPNLVGGYRSVNELNFWGHLSTYFDLNPNLSLETGVSGLIDDKAQGRGDFVAVNGPSRFGGQIERRRKIAAADITLRYQPLDSSIHRGLVWGTEVLFNSADFDVLAPAGRLRQGVDSAGLYSYVETKLTRQWKAGFLFDWVEDAADNNNETFRYSPYISFNPSEFQLLRLQYSHTDPSKGTGLESSDAVYLQWQFIIGRHVHGFKQR